MLAAEAQVRLLIAYGREFTRPRPYRLEDLARAAGMSISGVRTAYDEDEIAEVTRLTGARASPPTRADPVTGGAVPGCMCTSPWPSLVVHTEMGDVIVEPAATPGGLACHFRAFCTGCGTIYPGPYRVTPAARDAKPGPSFLCVQWRRGRG
jgi:hypothetical protein